MKIVRWLSLGFIALSISGCTVKPLPDLEMDEPEPVAPPALDEVGLKAGDLCGASGNQCTDNGCAKTRGAKCVAFEKTCVCQAKKEGCTFTSAGACGNNGCEVKGSDQKCEKLGTDCVCVKHTNSTTMPEETAFTLDEGAGNVTLLYSNGAGDCAGLPSAFSEPAHVSVDGANLAIVTPNRELAGSIDPSGAFFARNADHEYVGTLAHDASGSAKVTYHGPTSCSWTFDVAFAK